MNDQVISQIPFVKKSEEDSIKIKVDSRIMKMVGDVTNQSLGIRGEAVKEKESLGNTNKIDSSSVNKEDVLNKNQLLVKVVRMVLIQKNLQKFLDPATKTSSNIDVKSSTSKDIWGILPQNQILVLNLQLLRLILQVN